MSDFYARKGMPTIYYSGKSTINPDDRTTPESMKQLSKSKHSLHPDFFQSGPAPSPVTSDDVLRANINLYEVDDRKTQTFFEEAQRMEQEENRKRVQFDLFSNQYDNLSNDGWARGKYAEQTTLEEKIARMRVLNERPYEAAGKDRTVAFVSNEPYSSESHNYGGTQEIRRRDVELNAGRARTAFKEPAWDDDAKARRRSAMEDNPFAAMRAERYNEPGMFQEGVKLPRNFPNAGSLQRAHWTDETSGKSGPPIESIPREPRPRAHWNEERAQSPKRLGILRSHSPKTLKDLQTQWNRIETPKRTSPVHAHWN